MATYLHHVHIFSTNVANTVAWWQEMLDGVVMFDGEFGGARNVFMRVGSGRLNIYDQAPRDAGKGAVHHIGIRTDDLRQLVATMREKGAVFRNDIREFGFWRYVMCAAPDDVLLELFEVDSIELTPELAAYFD